jgi:integrase
VNAFKRKRRDRRTGELKESATYYVRFELKGVAKLKKTPHTNAEQALAYGRALRTALEKTDCAAVKAALDTAAYRRTAPLATIGQLINAYRAHAGPVQKVTKDKTIDSYISALLNIISRAHYNLERHDRATAAQLTEIKNLPASILDAALITAYKKAAFTIAQQRADDQRADSTYRSANSIIIMARCLFIPALLAAYKTADLNLPDLKPFLEAPLFPKVGKKQYNPPDQLILAKTFAALPDLEQTEPDLYVAIWLALGFGLRREEICKTRLAWFVTINDTPHIHLDYKTKNGDYPTIRCHLDAWPKLQPHLQRARAEGREHLLHDNNRHVHAALWGRLGDWMRNLGWKTQKTLHEFRAFAGCKIAEAHGLLAASKWLRHESLTTTEENYGRYIDMRNLTSVPLIIPTIQPPEIVSNPETSAASQA